VDNPVVGQRLADIYWAPGNSEAFLDLVHKMTGLPLTGEAWVSDLNQSVEDKLAEEKHEYEMGLKASAGEQLSDTVDLNMHVILIDGDEVIADSEVEGGFVPACNKFADFVSARVLAQAN
jgi:hypothetical protein